MLMLMMRKLVTLAALMLPLALAFQPVSRRHVRTRMMPATTTISTSTKTTTTRLHMASNPEDPQVLATGYSQAMELTEAIQEATDMALQALPVASADSKIDLCIVSVSSLYDGNVSPSIVVPTILQAASKYGQGIQHLVGSTNGGFISSVANLERPPTAMAQDDEENVARACRPTEREGVPGVSVSFGILPDVELKVSSSGGFDNQILACLETMICNRNILA
jgi:hypothetical protein